MIRSLLTASSWLCLKCSEDRNTGWYCNSCSAPRDAE